MNAHHEPNAPTRRAFVVAGCALLGASCSLVPDRDHAGDDAPQARPLAKKPRTAWVLGSGGPRGGVHVGVLKALDELKLTPDVIVGSSIGAVVGVLRAFGMRSDALIELTMNVKPWDIGRLALSGSGRLSSLGVADWAHAQIDGKRLQDLPTAMVSVSYNQSLNQMVAFTAGDASVAVAASSAIEGQLTPVRIRGDLHTDADGYQPLPVRIARQLGAERVLAVDASAHEEKAPPGTERWRDADMRKRALTLPDARLADVLLHPDSGYFASVSRAHRELMVEVGYRSAMAQADKIRAMHQFG